MALNQCYKKGCDLEVKFACKCSSPEILSCEFHLGRHLKATNRAHNFESITSSTFEESKVSMGKDQGINKFKKEKSRKKDKNSLSQRLQNSKRRKLGSDQEIAINAEVDTIKRIITAKPIENKLEENSKASKNNSIIAGEKNSAIFPRIQIFQDYSNTYHQFGNVYLTERHKGIETKLIMFDTKNKKTKIKCLKTPGSLDTLTSIAQLPNGDLFCYGSSICPGITLIIHQNYTIRALPYGKPLHNSSSIYFNRSIYCFGGNMLPLHCTALSYRFDLDESRWIKLTELPGIEHDCNSVIFNGNIIISGYFNSKLLLYSTDIDSFSAIPYDFAISTVKILINTDRLYVLECLNGYIYESEIGNEYKWNNIGESCKITFFRQDYCSYFEGSIYIGRLNSTTRQYFEFNLSTKEFVTWIDN